MEQEQRVNAFAEIVSARRSVRGFLSEPVPRETLEQVFSLAQQAPSNCNTQPWLVHVASGETCERLRRALPEALLAGDFGMDFDYAGQYEGVYKERQHDAAYQLYTAMGIKREEKEKRQEAFSRNFTFYNAPHVAFLFMPEGFGIREAADLGMFAQTLMLGLSAHGIASCPQTALSFNARVVREQMGVPAEHKLLFGISFGYENPQASANATRVGRAGLGEAVTFHD